MVLLGNGGHDHAPADRRHSLFPPMFLQSNEPTGYFLTLRRAMWGLVGMVLLFDRYTVYQQLQIHRMRRRLFEREELFRLISDNAADMIAVVDMNGDRIYNSESYSRVLRYNQEELKHSSAFEQIHPSRGSRNSLAGRGRRAAEWYRQNARISNPAQGWELARS